MIKNGRRVSRLSGHQTLTLLILIIYTASTNAANNAIPNALLHKSDLLKNLSLPRLVPPEEPPTLVPLPTIASPEELEELQQENIDALPVQCRTDTCRADTTENLKGTFRWNSTSAGSYAFLPCPNGVWPYNNPNQNAYRACNPPPQGFLIKRMSRSLNSTWGDAHTEMCRWHSNITLQLEELLENLEASLAAMKMRETGNTTEVISYLKTVQSLLRNESLLTEEDVKTTAAIIELVLTYGMARVFDMTPSVGEQLTKITSNILDMDLEILQRSQDATLNIANSLEKYTETVIFPSNTEKIEHIATNVMIELNQPKENGWVKLPRKFSFTSSAQGDADLGGMTVVTIEVPDWEPKSYRTHTKTKEVKAQSSSTVVRSAVILYYTAKFFIPVTSGFTPVNDNVMVYLHAFADDQEVDSVKEPISVTFYHLVDNQNNSDRPTIKCGAGDLNAMNMTTGNIQTDFTPVTLSWSMSDCQLNSTNATYTRCFCNGLDLISLIKELIPPTPTPTNDPTPGSFHWLGFPYNKQIAILSYIGYILSIISLILTIMTYAIYPNLRRGRPTLILVNLSFAVLLLLLVLVISSSMSKDISGCRWANFLRSYFILVSMMWNGVEAVNLYLALVKVFTPYTSHFVLRSGIIAWGAPLIIVATPFVFSLECYDGKYSNSNCAFTCTLRTNTYYWVFVFPMTVIVIFNATVFGLVLQVIKDKAKNDNNRENRSGLSQLRGAVALFVLLGLTWVFGAAAVINYNSVKKPLRVTQVICQVLFVIGLTFQGFFIFVFHCARYKDVREQWKISLSCLNLKSYLKKRRHNRQKRKSSDSQASTSDLVPVPSMLNMMDTSL